MTIAEFLTSWVAIATSGFFAALFVLLFVFRYKEVLEWEAEHLWSIYDEMCDKLKRFIRRLLRKSSRIVAWAEKPAKHGRPDADFIEGQVKVYGDVWR